MEASLILFSLGVVNVVSTASVSIVVVMLAIELPNVDVWCDAMVSVVAYDVVHNHSPVVPAIVPTVVLAIVSWSESVPPGLVVDSIVKFFISVNKLVPVEFVMNRIPLVTGGLVTDCESL